ncbi:MAG: efflux RND transporter permease subunit, partial [Planctomycetota bacterium]
IFGPSLARLQDIGESIRHSLESHPQVLHTQMTLSRGEPKLWFDANEDKARLSGLGLVELANQLGANLEGSLGGAVLENLEQLPVRVRHPESGRSALDRVASTAFVAGTDRWVPLEAIGSLELEPELGGITRFNGERCNMIRGFTTRDALPIDVTRAALAKVQNGDFELPDGYRLELGGAIEQDSEATGNLLTYVPILATIMISTLVLTFRSVQLAIVLGLIAGLSVGLGLLSTWLASFPVSFNTFLGMLGLMGVALNDSIVVIAAIRANDRAREGEISAIVSEVSRCTRHVLSTTLTTIGGFLPLLVVVGGKFWPSLAIVLVGGIGGATILALLFVPAVYVLLNRRANDLNDNTSPVAT